MDNYLPHSTLADMNATHLDIERVRIAAMHRAQDMLEVAMSLRSLVDKTHPFGFIPKDYRTIMFASDILEQLAEGK